LASTGHQILAKGFENRGAQTLVGREGAIFHFREEGRFHPRGFRFLHRHRQRRGGANIGVEAFAQLIQHRVFETGLGLAGIEQLIAVPPS